MVWWTVFFVSNFAGKTAFAAVNLVMPFVMILGGMGFMIGSAPVVSYHYGAGNSAELKSMLKKSALLTTASGLVLTALAFGLAVPLARVFVGYDAQLLALTGHAFRLFSFSFLLAGFNIFASSFFTELNNGAVSAIISFLRTLVFQTASVLLLPLLLGVDGIWWAITVAELCASILSVGFLLANRKKYRY